MILLIDNYDSFAYNLYQMIGAINPDIKVVRNDKITCEEIEKISPEKIILSPGPGRPENAGIILDVVKNLGAKIPILGVCLGHQAICMAFGAKITYAKKTMHGKQSETKPTDATEATEAPDISGDAVYAAITNATPADVTITLSDGTTDLSNVKEGTVVTITAKTSDDEIMAVQHKNFKIFGVQFHPESILTPTGKIILKNFLEV